MRVTLENQLHSLMTKIFEQLIRIAIALKYTLIIFLQILTMNCCKLTIKITGFFTVNPIINL